MKILLRKVLGRACLSYEEMITVLCDCELTLNSRPLTYLSGESDDLKPLTPLMFIHEIREIGTPDIDIINQIDLSARFKRKQEIMEHLRKRFRKEYLSQLILKGKCKEPRKLKVGDVVIVGDDTHKRIDWPLARIERLIEGRDGVVRVALLRTSMGQFSRPIQRVYPLEIQDESLHNVINMREKAVEKADSVIHKSLGEEVFTKEPCNNYTTRGGRCVKAPNRYGQPNNL